MASSATGPSTPSTPNNAPQRLGINRSFTTPSKLATTSRNAPTAEIGAAEGIETLYVHPSASIIKFSTSGKGAGNGTLPWASLTERTMAAGPLEIYRVPGSVSFLHSGALLHAILPRSNCWCVDGVSKFALRVLPDIYYRIELPAENPEDSQKVEEMKETLRRVLFYERTPCPFARTFTIELPDEPSVRKAKRRSHGPAKKWKLDRAYSWKPEDGGEPQGREREDSSGSASIIASDEEENELTEDEEHRREEKLDSFEPADEVNELNISTPSRPLALAAMRSVTAPPQLSLNSTSPSRARSSVAVDDTAEANESIESSNDSNDLPSLRTFQAIPTDMPPSPPDSSAGLKLVETLARTEPFSAHENASKTDSDRDVHIDKTDEQSEEDTHTEPDHSKPHHLSLPYHNSETALRIPYEPRTAQRDTSPHAVVEQIANEERSQTPAVAAAAPDDPFMAIQARILARRSLSGTATFHPASIPPPRQTSSSSHSSTSSLTSRRSQSSQRQQALASALVRKAYTVFLGPSAHLVAIMLRIAARFANGTFGTAFASTFLIESPAGSKRVPGSFNLESIDAEDLDDPEIEEDDFGVPLRSPIRLANLHRSASGLGERERERRGWDID